MLQSFPYCHFAAPGLEGGNIAQSFLILYYVPFMVGSSHAPYSTHASVSNARTTEVPKWKLEVWKVHGFGM